MVPSKQTIRIFFMIILAGRLRELRSLHQMEPTQISTRSPQFQLMTVSAVETFHSQEGLKEFVKSL